MSWKDKLLAKLEELRRKGTDVIHDYTPAPSEPPPPMELMRNRGPIHIMDGNTSLCGLSDELMKTQPNGMYIPATIFSTILRTDDLDKAYAIASHGNQATCPECREIWRRKMLRPATRFDL